MVQNEETYFHSWDDGDERDGTDAGPTHTAVPGQSQDDLRQRSLEALEWPKVRAMLAGQTHFFRARELADEIEPRADIESIERLQDETTEARRLLDTAGDIGLGGLDDPRPLLRRASLGGMLTGRELLNVVRALEAMWAARETVHSMGRDTPRLGTVAAQVPDLRWLRGRVEEAIDDNGQVRDSATPRLGELRASVAGRYRRLRNHLERLIGRPTIRRALQSPVIATRGDRLVVEVQANQRSVVPGIVHDVSNTGATLFVEPFDAVDLCNQWREAAAEVVREEEKVLRRLSELLGERRHEGEMAVEAAGALDLIVARGRLAIRMRAHRAAALLPGSDVALELVDARHPLLGDHAVPVTISIGPDFRALVITGPNTGGKTVALKTAGLLALMHHAGLHIPADSRSRIAVFDGIYADIGDAQSIERSMSTFSSHLTNVVRVLEQADECSLVLLDELGTGTDPEEGSALARAILADMLDRDIPAIVTTHHRAVAEFAGETPGMRNASVELDPDTMEPLYRVVMGTPGRSYAIAMAERIGLPRRVLENARSFLAPEHTAAERLLLQLQRERAEMEAQLAQAHAERAAAEWSRRDMERRLAELTDSQDELVERTRAELARQAEEVRGSLRRIQAQARNEHELAVARREAERIQRSLRRPDGLRVTRPIQLQRSEQPETVEPEQHAPEPRPISAGDIVEVRGLNARATVLEPHSDGSVSLMMGNARVTLNATQVKLVTPAEQAPKPPERSAGGVRLSTSVIDAPSRELDLRGIRAHEVFDRVTSFLDQASLLGLTSVRIVHGRGTGALRNATREALMKHPSVAEHHSAEPAAGGDGATEVELL